MRVGGALVLHEFQERARDRWVLVATGVFALLALSIGLYGKAAADSAAVVAAPSLVTLAAFLVPLVALVLGHDAVVSERERNTLGLLLSLPVRRAEVVFAKFIGRLLALIASIALGLGLAATQLDRGQALTLLWLVPHTTLLGAAFLSLGVFVSVITKRASTAATIAIVAWFGMVFLYDLGLLGLLVVTDGALSAEAVRWAVNLNPAGLYRVTLIEQLTGQGVSDTIGVMTHSLAPNLRAAIWTAWVAGPLGLGALILTRTRSVNR